MKKIRNKNTQGSALILALILMIILTLSGLAMVKVAQGRLVQAVRVKNEQAASFAAEAAYEKALFWMSQQPDMLSALEQSGVSGDLSFSQSDSEYQITFSSFIGSRPVYTIRADGHCGIFQKTIEANVVQAISGWEMGACRVPSGPTTTTAVSFVAGELIDMPIHINDAKDSPDARDISISGSPSFLRPVSMGESRYTAGGSDKYASVMNCFTKGISFKQPASRIADTASIQSKVDRFRDSTNTAYCFTPAANSGIAGGQPAVQLEFFVGKDGIGYVQITENCTVVGYTRTGSSSNSWDYKLNTSGSGDTYVKYPIYGYHYIPGNAAKRYTRRIDNPQDPIYVSQSYGGVSSPPGAQIYVNGNVIIGSKGEFASSVGQLNTVKGQITVVATGNIWIANELKVAGQHAQDGMPSVDNTNVVGLIAQGVVKVVDSGMTTNGLLTAPPAVNKGDNYEPIGNKDPKSGSPIYDRILPGRMVVEAAVTVGGGGWGAENVYRGNTANDRENGNGSAYDELILRGTLTEVIRGVVGIDISSSQKNGYRKYYYYDTRLMSGILPSNIWLKGKYLLIPGGLEESASVREDCD